MSDVSQWNVSAASNNSTPPDGAPEGMAASAVNDTMREMMAAVARLYGDIDGTLTSGGTSGAYTLTSTQTFAALADQSILIFRANHSNTGSATLNVDSLGAKAIEYSGGGLKAGMIASDTIVAVVYNATGDHYDLLNPQNDSGSFTATLTGMTSATSGTINYVREGSLVTLYRTAGNLQGTSDETSFTMTGIPSAVQPSATRFDTIVLIDSGTTQLGAGALTSGTLTFYKGPSSLTTGTFTASGNKGVPVGWSFTYLI